MKYLYLWLNLGSFIIPFIFSFHPRLKFYKKWRSFFPSVALMMLLYISWDVIFTKYGIWGFNEDYLCGINILNLPLEEWLFFICIPYACIFTHYALHTLMPRFSFNKSSTQIIQMILLSAMIVCLWYYYDRWYTLVNFSYTIILLGLVYNCKLKLLQAFFPSFFIILLPFFLVNGVLTGSFIEAPVVWYNNTENIGFRLGTIPVEDTMYALGMLLTVLFAMEIIEHRKLKN
jgi:lycopene cyclase domain-containing protein